MNYGRISITAFKALSAFEPFKYYDSMLIPFDIRLELINSNYIKEKDTLFGKQFKLNTENEHGFNNPIHHYTS